MMEDKDVVARCNERADDTDAFDSEEEKTMMMRCVKELRSRIEKRTRVDEKEERYARRNMNDQALWRFVLAHNMDVDAAENMFVTAMKWRAQIDMDRLMASFDAADRGVVAADDDADATLAALGRRIFYGWQMGVTKDGAPLLIERLGKADLSGIASNDVAMKAAVRAYAVYLEKSWSFLAAKGEKERGMIVVDLDGISMSMLWNISVLKTIIHAGPLFYPEITKRVFIIRTPYFFTSLWSLVKPFIPSRTQDKIRILGHDFQDELDKVTRGGIDALPSFLGGKVDVTANHPEARLGARVQDCVKELLLCEKALSNNKG